MLPLINRAKKGDGAAFYALIQDRKEHLYRIAYCYVKNEQDALDLVSEAITKAYIALPKLKEPAYFETWLIRILINCAIDFLKKARPLRPMILDFADEMPAEAPDQEEIMDLYRAIDSLDGLHKTIILLLYLEDKTIVQAAELLKMPAGTVKTYLNRALKQLRMKMKEVG